jgi:hypothetical protein
MYNSHAINDNLNLAYPNTSCLRRISSDESIHNNRGVACWVGRRFAESDRAASSSQSSLSSSIIVLRARVLVRDRVHESHVESVLAYVPISPAEAFYMDFSAFALFLVGAAVLVFSLEL